MVITRGLVGAVAAVLLVPATALGAFGDVLTLAGTGSPLFAGDGGLALDASFDTPLEATAMSGGGYLVADSKNNRIRRISPRGTISTAAGSGLGLYDGDGGAAVDTALFQPGGVAALPEGNFLVADTRNNRIRKVSPGGLISTVAGKGIAGFAGDGGPATGAKLWEPGSVAGTPDGGFLVADTRNHRVRRVGPDGTINNAAGDGWQGFGGDGGDATQARLDSPDDVALLPDGGFLVADTGNDRVRRVSPSGVISTVAGSGVGGFGGDGGPAVAATLDAPRGVAATSDGGFLIADSANQALRRVAPDGTISTVVGRGLAASLDLPVDVDATPSGIVIADAGAHRVRLHDLGLAGVAQLPGAGSSELPPPLPPKLGRRFNAAPERGVVRVKLPGRRRFVLLSDAASLPVGTVFDTRRGAVRLTVARNVRGATQSATFWQGVFHLAQTRGARPVTELTLRTPPCVRHGRRALAARRPATSRLWSKGKGRFRTRGRHGAATVRGTEWLTVNRCDGTLVRVRRGLVAVRDFARKRTVLVPAGRSYLARR